MSADVSIQLYEIAQEFIPDEKKAREVVNRIEEVLESELNSEIRDLAVKWKTTQCAFSKFFSPASTFTSRWFSLGGIGQLNPSE